MEKRFVEFARYCKKVKEKEGNNVSSLNDLMSNGYIMDDLLQRFCIFYDEKSCLGRKGLHLTNNLKFI